MTTRNETFTRLAHRRQVLLVLQRYLKETHLEMEGSECQPIICEDVTYADRFVSQEAMLDVLDALQQLEAMETLSMGEFEFKKRDIPPLRLPPPPKAANDQTVSVPDQQNPPGQKAQEASPPQDEHAGGGPGPQPGSPPR